MSVSPAAPQAPQGNLEISLHQVGVDKPAFKFNWDNADKGYGFMVDPKGEVWRVTKTNFAGQVCFPGAKAIPDIEKVAQELWLKMEENGTLATIGNIRLRGTEYITTDLQGNKTTHRTQNRILPNGFLRAKEHLSPYALDLYKDAAKRCEGDKFPEDPKEANKVADKALMDFADTGWVKAELEERQARQEAKDAAARGPGGAGSPRGSAGAGYLPRSSAYEPYDDENLDGAYSEESKHPSANPRSFGPPLVEEEMPDLEGAAPLDLKAPAEPPVFVAPGRVRANAEAREAQRLEKQQREAAAQPAPARQKKPNKDYRQHRLGQAAAAPQRPLFEPNSRPMNRAELFSHSNPPRPEPAFLEVIPSSDEDAGTPSAHAAAWETGGLNHWM